MLYSCLKFLPQISTADTVNGLYGLSAAMTAGEGEGNDEGFVLTHLNKKMANSALVQTYRLRHATRINATVKVSRIILKVELLYFPRNPVSRLTIFLVRRTAIFYSCGNSVH